MWINRAILFQSLGQVHVTNEETSVCFMLVYQIKTPYWKGKDLSVLNIVSYDGFLENSHFGHGLRNTAANTSDGVMFLLLSGYEPLFHR